MALLFNYYKVIITKLLLLNVSTGLPPCQCGMWYVTIHLFQEHEKEVLGSHTDEMQACLDIMESIWGRLNSTALQILSNTPSNTMHLKTVSNRKTKTKTIPVLGNK